MSGTLGNAALATLWMPDALTMRLVAPELALVATIALILIAPIFVGRETRATGLLALAGTLVATVLSILTLDLLSDGPLELFGAAAGPGMLVADRFGLLFRAFLCVFLAAIIGMWFLFDAPRERNAPEFFTLLVASALGMALMATSVNLILMIIAIELASMPSFALAGFDRFRRPAAEASVKYVLFGMITSGFMIYGVSVLYGLFGTLHIPTLVDHLATTPLSPALAPLLAIALLAVFAGIAFKISAVPFHFWCPDVFEGASLPVATWLSVASKTAGLVLLLRIVFLFGAPTVPAYVPADAAAGAAARSLAPSFAEYVFPTIAYGVGFFALLTCTFANLAAYHQTNVRRLLAYSSIAHAGYMLCAGAILYRLPGGAGSGDGAAAAALSAVFQYLLIYMVMNFGAFLALGLVAADTGSEHMESFTGLGWRDPAAAFSLTLCLISLIGLPPLGGFIAKFWLIAALGSTAQFVSPQWSPHQTTLLWLLVGGVVINTAISLFYYARIIRQMYLTGIGVAGGRLRAPLAGKLSLHLCAVLLLLAGTLLIGALKRSGDAAATEVFTATKVHGSSAVARSGE